MKLSTLRTLIFSSYRGSLLNFGKRYEDDIWVIFDQWHKLSGKNTHLFFFYFLFKNKRVWAEKIGKKRKNSKNLKVAGNYPSI